MAKQILITGALGFIGRHLARAAARAGHRVIGIGRGQWSADFAQAWGYHDGRGSAVTTQAIEDLCHASGVSPDWILHCAGTGSVASAAANPASSLHDNVTSAKSVFDYAAQHAPKAKTLLISSASVYGDSSLIPTPESHPTKPISVYGTHKVQAETLAHHYAKELRISIAVTRLFSVYGPGLHKQLWWDACQKAVNGQFHYQGTGTELRDFIHVEDVARLALLAVESASPQCPVWNGGCGQAVEVREVVGTIGKYFGAPAAVFDGNSNKDHPRALVAATERTRELGFRPRSDWRAGLAEYLEWFRAQVTRRAIS